MHALLVRVGIDLTSGGWNAPVNNNTTDPVYDFVYVPIPEGRQVCPEHRTTYDEFNKYCDCEEFEKRLPPDKLKGKNVHLDPDFYELSYGDVDGCDFSSKKTHHRGKPIRELNDGDILAFYAGLKPIKREPEEDRLVYAIIGLYIVDGKPISAKDLVNKGERGRNAHTRGQYNDADIIVFGKREDEKSGRLTKCIPIGKRRGKGKQYRLTEKLRDRWGGLRVKDKGGNRTEVNDAWIQRSVRLPYIGNPTAFYEWFLEELDKWHIRLVPRNNLD